MSRVLVEALQVFTACLQVALLLEQDQSVLCRLDFLAARLVQFPGQPLDFPAKVILIRGHGHAMGWDVDGRTTLAGRRMVFGVSCGELKGIRIIWQR